MRIDYLDLVRGLNLIKLLAACSAVLEVIFIGGKDGGDFVTFRVAGIGPDSMFVESAD